ncbi:hypothetical protein [Nostoc sp. FACHB-888]|uniref:hypothetical protein n=1 Tax=Nostoc sp. FACHB-888 TaxID=2692842 RepID=UPI001689C161|nr:hypothetical protein [Nostoc sp. FACHB-888]MBD2249156.1 hypothetical protein [Nostoc sp. FACHB-888]
MKIHKVTHQSSLPSNTRNKLILRRTRKRFNPKVFIDRTIETTAIASLLITGFSGVGAMGCWGIEIATSSHYWQQQKSICLGAMLVSFSTFLGTSLVGASLSIQRDKF